MVQILSGKEVPLGGADAMTVRRTIPQRDRPCVGAWCFADHYGPSPAGPGQPGRMDVPPHPHTGLQTVSWLFAGELEHRDSSGVVAVVRPGELNLMTSGHGIAHSEVSTPATAVLHGVQLWVVLPEANRGMPRGVVRHIPPEKPLPGSCGTAKVFLGRLPDVDSSPVATATPLLGAQLDLTAGAEFTLPVECSFEHGVLVDDGVVRVDGVEVGRGDLAVVEPGQERLTLQVGAESTRVVLLGGTPFEEEFVMWWNFVGASHEEVAAARDQWNAREDRFGEVPGYQGPTSWLPAPPLPTTRLKARRRHPPHA
ncbi:pirin family protein [Austwickia chelonae]|uniref:pirin family protein n=1 Tax=Austwickia chelonae TaxID=100225 RepID=UPI001F081EA3|nr:pirin family protein [Austwickia chelonae]